MVFLSRSSLHLTDSILCAAYRQEGPQGFFPPAPRRAALGSASSHRHSAAAVDVRRAQLAACFRVPYDRLILKISRSGIRLQPPDLRIEARTQGVSWPVPPLSPNSPFGLTPLPKEGKGHPPSPTNLAAILDRTSPSPAAGAACARPALLDAGGPWLNCLIPGQ